MAILRNPRTVFRARNGPWEAVPAVFIPAILFGVYLWGSGYKHKGIYSNRYGPITWEKYHKPKQTGAEAFFSDEMTTLNSTSTLTAPFGVRTSTFDSPSAMDFQSVLESILDSDAPWKYQILMLLVNNLAIIVALLQLIPLVARTITRVFNVLGISDLLRVVGVEWFCNYVGIMWILRQVGIGYDPFQVEVSQLLLGVEFTVATMLKNSNITTNAIIRSALHDSTSMAEKSLYQLRTSLEQAMVRIVRDNISDEDPSQALNVQALALVAMRDNIEALPGTVCKAAEAFLVNESALTGIADKIIEDTEKNLTELGADVKASVKNKMKDVTEHLSNMRKDICMDTSKCLKSEFQSLQKELKSELQREVKDAIHGERVSLLQIVANEIKSEIGFAIAENIGELKASLTAHNQTLRDGLRADLVAAVAGAVRDIPAPIAPDPLLHPELMTREDLTALVKDHFTQFPENFQSDVQNAVISLLPTISQSLETDVGNSVEKLLPKISEKLQADLYQAANLYLPEMTKNIPIDIKNALEILVPHISDRLQSDIRIEIGNLHPKLSSNLTSDVSNTIRNLLPDTGMEGLALNIAQDVTVIMSQKADTIDTAAAAVQRSANEVKTAVDRLAQRDAKPDEVL
jgi:hypothetical protein